MTRRAHADGPAGSPWPGRSGWTTLTRLVDGLGQGVAVLSEDDRVLHVNAAGCAILGCPREELLGRSGPVPPSTAEREFECSDTWLVAEGRRVRARAFRDVTDERRATRRQATLSQVAARAALTESLETTLETVAQCLVDSTGTTACAAIVFEGEPARSRVSGTAGLPADYAERDSRPGRGTRISAAVPLPDPPARRRAPAGRHPSQVR